MDLENIKRGLRAEIKKRENEQYLTFQCNVRQMCKDVLAKLEEQESVIADKEADYKEACDRLKTANLIKDEQLAATRHHKLKRCLAMAKWCEIGAQFQHNIVMQFDNPFYIKRAEWLEKWHKRWLALAEKFKEAK